MDINRNQCFLIGLVILFLGIQFRMVESVEFTPEFTKILAEQNGHPIAAASDAIGNLLNQPTRLPPKAWHPDDRIGYLLLSIGSVLILHSLTMKKPG